MRNIFAFLFVGIICSCSSKLSTFEDPKYLPEFHEQNSSQEIDILEEDALSLYVDFSTCNVLGQHAKFYQALVPSWTAATESFYSIKGDTITLEDGKVYELLKTIREVNYADLKSAIDSMANGHSESVLITDGEYYQKSLARANVNNPFMVDAFKKWIRRGHDIYIFSEPYIEPYKGKEYNKKRFYIVFTDTRLKGNIYERITKTVSLEDYEDIEVFHLSADHPVLRAESSSSKPNEILNAKVNGYGDYEIQDWPIDWESIESLIVNAVDPNTGQPLEYGEPILTGLNVDRNSFGGYRIKSLSIKVSDINQAYTDFAEKKEAGQKIIDKTATLEACPNFIRLDEKEFDSHGNINLYFDTKMYDPSLLNGEPFNYFKIDIYISDIENTFMNNREEMFKFDSIDVDGETNVSVSESIKQCLVDPGIVERIKTYPIYSIYIKSPER